MSTPPHVALRGLARAIDLAVQAAVLDVAFRASVVLPDALFVVQDRFLLAVDVGVGLGSLVLYTTLAEWLGGATLGKLLTGLRVATMDFGRIGGRAALVRSLAFCIDGLFLGFVGYTVMARSPERRRLGDEWAGTRVVWRDEVDDRGARTGWIAGALSALVLVLLSYALVA